LQRVLSRQCLVRCSTRRGKGLPVLSPRPYYRPYYHQPSTLEDEFFSTERTKNTHTRPHNPTACTRLRTCTSRYACAHAHTPTLPLPSPLAMPIPLPRPSSGGSTSVRAARTPCGGGRVRCESWPSRPPGGGHLQTQGVRRAPRLRWRAAATTPSESLHPGHTPAARSVRRRHRHMCTRQARSSRARATRAHTILDPSLAASPPCRPPWWAIRALLLHQGPKNGGYRSGRRGAQLPGVSPAERESGGVFLFFGPLEDAPVDNAERAAVHARERAP
jgi:hypothetical protein